MDVSLFPLSGWPQISMPAMHDAYFVLQMVYSLLKLSNFLLFFCAIGKEIAAPEQTEAPGEKEQKDNKVTELEVLFKDAY